MRWRYAETLDELARRQEILNQIDAWWHAFGERANDIDRFFTEGGDIDLPQFLAANLQTIEPRLMWEFGPGTDGDGHRLVMTAESDHELGPLVDAILERAPTLERWQFFKFRVADSAEQAANVVEARTQRDITGWKARPVRDGKKVNLTFFAPGLARTDRDQAAADAVVAADALLGEEMVNKWVGFIDVEKLKSGRGFLGLGRDRLAEAIELDALRSACDDLVASIRDELPQQPQFALEDAETGFVYELEPEEAEDYSRATDMFVGTGTIDGFVEAVRAPLFHSTMFSSCGETFCYLKLDGKGRSPEERLADKNEIDDALDEVLRGERCGCSVGGGTGLRYSYVDLALTDVAKAIDLIRPVLRRRNVPTRSWILFYDSDLADEWIGTYDRTPPPP